MKIKSIQRPASLFSTRAGYHLHFPALLQPLQPPCCLWNRLRMHLPQTFGWLLPLPRKLIYSCDPFLSSWVIETFSDHCMFKISFLLQHFPFSASLSFIAYLSSCWVMYFTYLFVFFPSLDYIDSEIRSFPLLSFTAVSLANLTVFSSRGR